MGAQIPNEIIGEYNTEIEEDEFVKRALRDSGECPKCREIVSKKSKVNLLQCYRCKTQFCYTCGLATPDGKMHYEISNCYYEDPETLKKR